MVVLDVRSGPGEAQPPRSNTVEILIIPINDLVILLYGYDVWKYINQFQNLASNDVIIGGMIHTSGR